MCQEAETHLKTCKYPIVAVSLVSYHQLLPENQCLFLPPSLDRDKNNGNKQTILLSVDLLFSILSCYREVSLAQERLRMTR